MIAGRGAGFALLGLAGLLFVVGVLSAWSGASRYGGREDAHRTAEEAAAAFVLAYGTFDFRDEDGYTERLLVHTTGELRDAIATAELDPDARRQRRSIATRIESASVTALSDGEATVVVTAVQDRRWVDPTLGQSLHEEIRQRVICLLVREDRRWLLAGLRLQSEKPVRRRAR